MSSISIKTAKVSDYKEVAPFVFAGARGELVKRGTVFYACVEDTPCGAIGGVERDGALQVISLFVAQEYRRRGIASLLLREMEGFAQNCGFPGIYASYSCKEEAAADLERFFLENDYTLPEAGNVMYTVSLEKLEKSAFAELLEKVAVSEQNIIPIRSMNREMLAELHANTPEYLLLKQAAGKPIGELCLAYRQGNQITSFVTMTDVNGSLHLHSAYLSSGLRAKNLLSLLKAAFLTIRKKYPHYQTMTVTGSGQSGHELIKKLIEGAALEEVAVYTTEKVFAEADMEYLSTDAAAALVRFNSLMDTLAEKGYASRMVLLQGAKPYLEIPFAEDAFIGLHYDVAEDDMLLNFRLIAEYILCPQEEAQRERILQQIERDEEPYYAIVSDRGEILLRGTLSEDDSYGLDTETIIEGLVCPFSEYAGRLHQAYIDRKIG